MKLTHAEHAARALLLGRIYDWRDGTYCTKSFGLLDAETCIDAETLEPVTAGVAATRRTTWGYLSTFYRHTDPPLPTPYADE